MLFVIDRSICCHMMSGTSVAAYISLPHGSIVAHMQDPLSKFYGILNCAHKLLLSLPTILAWVKFRTRYHKFIISRVSGWDGPRFQA